MDSSGHQEHENVASIVRHWFHDSFDEMGYAAVPRQWGTYWSNGQVYVAGLDVTDMDRFFEDLRTYFAEGAGSILTHLDNPEDEKALGPALSETGCAGPATERFLAHIGEPPDEAINSLIRMVPVTSENLALFADTKLRAWTDSEPEPADEALQAEIKRRQRELEGTGWGLVALMNQVPAGFIWCHEDPTRIRWIRQLATRSPFRKQGVATAMIKACLATAYPAGNIAVVISVDPANRTAFDLYQRLGFSDRVYDLYTYTLSGDDSSE
jgi:GNAT superfamily N-acetyltransferase